MAFTHRLRVRYGECDAQGIVFNAHYLAYVDVGLTELQRDAFGSYGQMIEDHGVDLVVAEAQVRYRTPARFDDLLDVELRVPRLGTTSMTLAFALSRAGEEVASGELRYVFVDARSWEKTPIPGAVRDLLAPYA